MRAASARPCLRRLCHPAEGEPGRDELQRQIEAFATLGLIVELTELGIGVARVFGPREPLGWQADRYRDVFEACLAVPACTGITTRGVGDADTWLDTGPWPWRWNRPNRPLLFDVAYAPKPAHSAVCKALLGGTVPRSGYGPRGEADVSSSNEAHSLGNARMMPSSGEPR